MGLAIIEISQAGRPLIVRSVVRSPDSLAACPSILGQDNETPIAPDEQAGNLHDSFCHQCMTVFLNGSM